MSFKLCNQLSYSFLGCFESCLACWCAIVLTWLPDAFWSGQSVAEDALVPQTSKPVNDTPALVQHCALHLVLVCVRTPIARLQHDTNAFIKALMRNTRGQTSVEAALTLTKVILQVQTSLLRLRMVTSP